MRTCSCGCGRSFVPVNARQRFATSQCRDRKLGRKPRVRYGTTTSRGYGADHQKIRRELRKVVQAGQGYCWRPNCGRRIPPDQPGQPTGWHVGHDDHDRSIVRGIECAHCNTSNAAKIGNARRVQPFTSSAPRIAR